MSGLGKACASCGGTYGPEVLFCPLDGSPLSRRAPTLSSPTDPDPYLNLELPGQITIQALVGIGSMGRVYRAFQSGVDRDVAVKILHRELTGNAELVARFHREAKIASKLLHPNVVQALMTGTLPTSANEVYLVMEYLDGISLLSALAAQGEGGALPLARTLHIALQLCDAVGEAHATGIVHRDLKPDNIMLIRRSVDPDFVKVLDFGIARLDSTFEGSSTQAGRIFGTAKYISPEGAEGKVVGPQADVYSIATIVYQCLAGRTPFEGEAPMAVLLQQINAEPPELSDIERAAYVPAALARVIMQNLSKDPSARAENARALGRDLAQAARDAGLHVDASLSGIPKGDLRLVSMQRTRQHAFTPELKATIAAANAKAAASNGASPTGPSPSGAGKRPVTEIVEPPASGPRSAPPAPPPPSSRPSAQWTRVSDDDLEPSDPQPGDDATHGPGHTQLAGADDTIHGSLEDETSEMSEAIKRGADSLRAAGLLAKPGPTMPGEPISAQKASPTMADIPAPASKSDPGARESVDDDAVSSERAASAEREEERRSNTRWLLLVACLVLPITAVAAFTYQRRRDAAAEAAEPASTLARAEEALRQRAWVTPPGDNVLELTDAVLAASPGDARALEIRRAAAHELVNDALEKKFAGAREEARALAQHARTLAPDLKSAEHLLAELTADGTTQATSAPTSEPSSSAQPTLQKGARTVDAKTSSTSLPTLPTGKPTSTAESLAPPPPPDLTPPHGSSGPWL